jgi:hypothetical protein
MGGRFTPSREPFTGAWGAYPFMGSGGNRFVLTSMARSVATKSLDRGDWRQILENKRIYRERRFRVSNQFKSTWNSQN